MRRLVAIPAVLALSLLSLTACGDDEDAPGDSGSVTVTGEFGSAPTVKFDGQLNRSDSETEVLTEGDGAEIEEGDSAFLHIYVGNGFNGEKAISTWDQKAPQFTVLNDEGMGIEPLREAVIGSKVGSRIEIVASPDDAFEGMGNSAIGIGNGDTVVFVVDVVRKVLDAPEGAERTPPAGLPTVVEEDGKVTSLDFASAASTSGGRLRVVPLVEGTGPAIEKRSAVALRYLGHVWGGAKPFDENYSAETPTLPDASGQQGAAIIGVGNYIKAWDRGLIGVKEGSRVLLVVPSELGYGKKGSGENIKPNQDLVFVIDVLGVA